MTGPRPKIKQIKKPAQDTTKLKRNIKSQTFVHGLLNDETNRLSVAGGRRQTPAVKARADSAHTALFTNRENLRANKAKLKKTRGKSTDRRGAKKVKES